MPTKHHQSISAFLYDLLRAAVDHRGRGETYYAPYRVRVPGRFREPDLVCILARNAAHAHDSHTDAADLIVEVVSPDDPDRDRVEKRADYAAARIPEYWIADPRDRTITVLTLPDGADEYADHGTFREGDTAAGLLLDGLTADVTACFATR